MPLKSMTPIMGQLLLFVIPDDEKFYIATFPDIDTEEVIDFASNSSILFAIS